MEQIYRYELKYNEASVEIPKDSQILSVSEQNGSIFMWVKHDKTEYEKETCVFHIVGTGQGFSDFNCKYFDTVFMKNGLVLHVFFEN